MHIISPAHASVAAHSPRWLLGGAGEVGEVGEVDTALDGMLYLPDGKGLDVQCSHVLRIQLHHPLNRLRPHIIQHRVVDAFCSRGRGLEILEEIMKVGAFLCGIAISAVSYFVLPVIRIYQITVKSIQCNQSHQPISASDVLCLTLLDRNRQYNT